MQVGQDVAVSLAQALRRCRRDNPAAAAATARHRRPVRPPRLESAAFRATPQRRRHAMAPVMSATAATVVTESGLAGRAVRGARPR